MSRPPARSICASPAPCGPLPASAGSLSRPSSGFPSDPPGSLWRGAISPSPLLRIAAVDRFIDGHGNCEISAWGKIPLSTASGPLWLSPTIAWEPIDARAVRLTRRVNAMEASSRVTFDDHGLASRIQARRYRVVGKRFELTPWFGRCEDYREANGILIPHRIAVTWGLPQGDFEWLRASLDEIEYA